MEEFKIFDGKMPEEFKVIAKQLKAKLELEKWFIGGTANYNEGEDYLAISIYVQTILSKRHMDYIYPIERRDLSNPDLIKISFNNLKLHSTIR